MDGRFFDDLTRAASETRSRRTALGLVAGAALSAALAQINPLAAKKRKNKNKNKNKNKKCRKLNQGCGGKKKCCKGFTCVDGTCGCPTGEIASGGKCINHKPPECDDDNDCGASEVCDDGVCVPEPPECDSDNDCNNGEICQDGECIPNPSECEVVDGRCIQRCESQGDCPGVSSCRNFSPETSPFIEDGVCVDEAFFLCDTTPCTTNNQCASDEVCVMLSCEGDVPVGRCQEFSVF